MRNRIGVAAAAILLFCAFALQAQQSMYKIKLNPSGSMIALDKPVLLKGKYVFHAWPHGEQTALRQAVVLSVAPMTGPQKTFYQVDLVPSGTLYAKDNPTLKGNTYVFHTFRDGTLMSLRQSDVKKVTVLTGDDAFWAQQGIEGESSIGNLAIQGASKVVVIGTPPVVNNAQAGRSNLSSVSGSGSGINGAPAGNWQYQGTPGTADAWGPANATVASPGDVPTMPAATNGSSAPTTPR
jgi:hypothetical protein